MLIVEAWQFIVAHPARFFGALYIHVALSAAALGLAIAIALPTGVLLADKARATLLAITAANIGRTLPSLAVLALVMPILGTGFMPSLFALDAAGAAAHPDQHLHRRCDRSTRTWSMPRAAWA
jgi:osmoprotectant transport system permease protein